MYKEQQILTQILGPVYLVGGAVRDSIMDKRPIDCDFATKLTPDVVIQKAKQFGYTSHNIGGQKYGTVCINLNDEFGVVEVTTFRKDFNQDGRRTDVEFASTIEEDLSRRDFSINSIAIADDGRFIDPYNGIDDIKKGIIRCVGSPTTRFQEDFLRIIRAARFASRFNFKIENSTFEIMKSFAPFILENVSIERIKMEFDKAFENEHPSQFIRILDDIGFLEFILPEISSLKGIKQFDKTHPEGDAFVHTLMTVDACIPKFRWAALLHDIGKAPTCNFNSEKNHNTFYSHHKVGMTMIDAIADRLKFSNELRKECKQVTRFHMRPFVICKDGKPTKTSIRKMIKDVGVEHLEALKQVCIADGSMRPSRKFQWDNIFDSIIIEEKSNIEPIIKGRHLIEHNIIEPGPEMGKLLKKLFDMQLNNEFQTVEEGIKITKEWVK